jgi:hypothetical protein
MLTGECAIESLYLRTPNRLLPTFGLDIHFLETELVQRNHCVDSSITWTTYPLQSSPTSSVPHSMHDVQHDSLEQKSLIRTWKTVKVLRLCAGRRLVLFRASLFVYSQLESETLPQLVSPVIGCSGRPCR